MADTKFANEQRLPAGAITHRVSAAPAIRVPVSVYTVLGLAALYASAYFLPLVSPSGAYFLPSRDLSRLVVTPAVAQVAAVAMFLWGAVVASRRILSRPVAAAFELVAWALMASTALKGVMDIAGFDWENRIPRSENLLIEQRCVKIAVVAVFLAAIYLATIHRKRPETRRWWRALASIGFAFSIYALVRILFLANSAPSISEQLHDPASSAIPTLGVSTAAPVNSRQRRVVWVILDETDFDIVYGAHGADRTALPNFWSLSEEAVFATNANSPSSATLFSIPSLLTGSPITGDGIRIDRSANLSLVRPDGTILPFDQASSVFGRLESTGRSASVLGFFHPYCRLFDVQRCDDRAWPSTTGIEGALWADIPGALSRLLGHDDTWNTITHDTLQLLPKFLARDDALTFLHLNIPHLPAAYADRLLKTPESPDPISEYAHNLRLADATLGSIVEELRRQSSRHDLLLIVSTDHWLRNRWYRPGTPEKSRRVPFIAWRVGEQDGIVLPQPLSTVHTVDMIMDFLDGKITTQAQIARWWQGKAVYPSLIAPNT